MEELQVYFDGFAAEKVAKEMGFTPGSKSQIPHIGLIPKDMLDSVIERKPFKHTQGTVWAVKLTTKGEEEIKKRLSSSAEVQQGKLLFI